MNGPINHVIAEAHDDLRKTAIDSIAYVAYGKVMAREIATKHGLTENEAERVLHRVATKLMDTIREIKL